MLTRRELIGAATAAVAITALPNVPAYAAKATPGVGPLPAGPGAWQFGIMADTQWKANLDGENPGTCAVGIIKKLNRQFIDHGVKFVVQVGDLVNTETDAANGRPTERTLPVRADAARELYAAGIGFYPLRGNHEGSTIAANEVPALFPQTTGTGANPLGGAHNFASPSEALKGLSYSFDVNNVRLVLLDQFQRRDGSRYGRGTNDNIVDQVPWVEQRLASRASGSHALVLAHKNLIGQNHTDVLFGGNPAENPAAQNAFIAACENNGVRYTVGGHDHVHHRAVITSPDRAHQVKELIASSNSYKFYTPKVPSNDERYNAPTREQVIAQELWTIGYYIVTVDGPRLWVDFYSTTHGFDYGDVDLEVTPQHTRFFWRERWGYSFNGREFVIEQGASYTAVQDRFNSTSMRILAGENTSTARDYAGRPMVKTINTGWKAADDPRDGSDVLYLWGINDNLDLDDPNLTGLLPDSDGPTTTSPFVLQMSYSGHGNYGIAGLQLDGTWGRAVEDNKAGRKKFVRGPWREGMPLGTFGIDSDTRTVWAVLDHDGVFQVRRGLGEQG